MQQKMEWDFLGFDYFYFFCLRTAIISNVFTFNKHSFSTGAYCSDAIPEFGFALLPKNRKFVFFCRFILPLQSFFVMINFFMNAKMKRSSILKQQIALKMWLTFSFRKAAVFETT